MKAAYDCVNRKILWSDMAEYGMNQHMISVCRSLFDHNIANLVVNGQQSRDIRCRRGLLQGSSLSPILFNIYINSLIVRLEKMPHLETKGVRTNNLFFADDGNLHAESPPVMQMMLNECSIWAVEYGMEFAAMKSAILTAYPDLPPTFKLQGGSIPKVDSVVYLGVESTPKGMCFNEKQKRRCGNMLSLARFLKAKGMNVSGWRPSCRIIAYKSFLRPMIEYGIPLMLKSDKMMETLERTQNQIYMAFTIHMW